MNRAYLSHPHGLVQSGRWWPSDGPFSLDHDEAYIRWRDTKLSTYPRTADEICLNIADLAQPSQAEHAAIISHCGRVNMAIYRSGAVGRDPIRIRPALRGLGTALGLRHVEDHRSAEADGIVAIEVASEGGRAGYIPYTNRPISWHTDGYYNYHGASECIQAMLLHCVRDAPDGGVNELLDPEIAYIRLRDRDPELIAALMHPEAMTIPEGEEAHGRIRPDNTGPVFFVEPSGGALVMRYTARKRYISWRDDPATRRALAALEEILASDSCIIRAKLRPGDGLICNNVLHNRSGFVGGAASGSGRLLYRVRYRDRITA